MYSSKSSVELSTLDCFLVSFPALTVWLTTQSTTTYEFNVNNHGAPDETLLIKVFTSYYQWMNSFKDTFVITLTLNTRIPYHWYTFSGSYIVSRVCTIDTRLTVLVLSRVSVQYTSYVNTCLRKVWTLVRFMCLCNSEQSIWPTNSTENTMQV